MSAVAWAQLGMASVYPRMVVMRALHKFVRRAHSASPWDAENTMCAVYAVAHHELCTQQEASNRLVCWLNNKARWNNQQHTGRVITLDFQPEGCNPAWCSDVHLLRHRANL